ncbi:MAG TPA: hypothetical protein VMK12_17195 [Anaeromyxobacteraceae bacterium]|nr:hypothetical protein [Anaeromyxobacteraceae bacterium]
MTTKRRATASKKAQRQGGPSPTRLDELIAEATVDAYDDSEQMTGFYTMFEEHLALPLKTDVLGVEVTVDRVDISDDERIVAVCTRGKPRQRIPILDLPLPTPAPEGSEWVDAYRRWARGR